MSLFSKYEGQHSVFWVDDSKVESVAAKSGLLLAIIWISLILVLPVSAAVVFKLDVDSFGIAMVAGVALATVFSGLYTGVWARFIGMSLFVCLLGVIFGLLKTRSPLPCELLFALNIQMLLGESRKRRDFLRSAASAQAEAEAA